MKDQSLGDGLLWWSTGEDRNYSIMMILKLEEIKYLNGNINPFACPGD
jgi:hypothetical protein